MNPKRGEIWWVNLDPTQGREIRKHRPCVILSADWLNRKRSTPVVVPLSSSPQSAPPVVVSIPSAGSDSVAVMDQMRAVDKRRFTHKTGSLSAADMKSVEHAARMILVL
ncbi:MAG: type II toxin-antitoxin system PemK/MazF family toxin [Verrucomicrobiae bacterium]|nr:type II toxin-antitoxin system PemK/MazF family toxin [Verrucomicrobiae bacterium]